MYTKVLLSHFPSAEGHLGGFRFLARKALKNMAASLRTCEKILAPVCDIFKTFQGASSKTVEDSNSE